MGSSKLILLSPLQGWSASLDEAPDPVFAGKMMGDGVAIDPTGSSLHAPCDGTLVVVPTSKHSVTLRADNGAEILLHVGIDTVALGGEGFELHVREGQRVRAGDRLISFDLDLLARRAKSLLTPIILTDTMEFSISRRSENCSLQVGDFLMEIGCSGDTARTGSVGPQEIALGLDAGAAVAQGGVGGTRTGVTAVAVPRPDIIERSVLVRLEHGIHARPAASLAAAVKSLTADVSVVFGPRKANAKSPVGLMSLGVRKGDQIVIQASGADAEAAMVALERAIAGGAEVGGAAPPAGGGASAAGSATVDAASVRGSAAPQPDKTLKGVVASRGLGVGQAFQFARATIEVAEAGAGVTHERAEFDRARETVRADLQRTVSSGNNAARESPQRIWAWLTIRTSSRARVV